MKACPSCRTQYTDDTLRFCLQDGTPLIAYPDADEPSVSQTGQEEETAVRARRHPTVAEKPVDTAWKSESQLDRVSPAALPKRRASTLAIASLAAAIVLLGLAIAGAVGLWRGTWAVGGSDSSCYALMAQAFATGRLQPSSTFARDAPWPDAQTTAAPGGFIPSPVRADASSPVCAPGFALLLAPLH